MTEHNSNKPEDRATPTVSFNELSSDMQAAFRKLQAKFEIRNHYHSTYFGHSPAIVSTMAFGRRIVAIRGSLYHSEDPNYEWPTPSDFLVSYLKSKLGIDWLSQEIQKNSKEQHEVAKWYMKGVPNIETNDGSVWAKPNGKALALLHLAYDLFVLDHIGKLPDVLIDRLKVNDNFNGARYEIFVFATLIRAGFNIVYSDERSGLSGRVPECLATHIESQAQIYVEAKTRNVKNVLGSKQGKSKKISLYDKLKNALEKNINGPYIIFIDTNLPELKAEKGNNKLEKIRAEYKKFETKYKDSMPNLVCVTNIPFHYGADNSSPNKNMIGLLIPRRPKHVLASMGKILASLDASLKKYDFLPKEFNEDEAFADKLLKDT